MIKHSFIFLLRSKFKLFFLTFIFHWIRNAFSIVHLTNISFLAVCTIFASYPKYRSLLLAQDQLRFIISARFFCKIQYRIFCYLEHILIVIDHSIAPIHNCRLCSTEYRLELKWKIIFDNDIRNKQINIVNDNNDILLLLLPRNKHANAEYFSPAIIVLFLASSQPDGCDT